MSMIVGQRVQRLNQIRPGDRVTVKYYQALAAQAVTPFSRTSEPFEGVTVDRRQTAERPGGEVTRVRRGRVTITAVDPATDSVSFIGPNNVPRTVVAQNPQVQVLHPQAAPRRPGGPGLRGSAGDLGRADAIEHCWQANSSRPTAICSRRRPAPIAPPGSPRHRRCGRIPAPAGRAAPAPRADCPPRQAPAISSIARPTSAGSAVRGVAISRPGKSVGRGGSWPWNSSSYSFSPGRRPVKRISTSSSGRRPASRIMRRARSTIFTGLPMSSTKMPPSASSGGWSSRSVGADHAGLQHQPHRLAHRHEVAAHVGMGDGQRPAAFELAAEQRHDRAGAAQHVAEAHGDAAHAGARRRAASPIQGLAVHLGQALGRAHDAGRVHRLVGRDEAPSRGSRPRARHRPRCGCRARWSAALPAGRSRPSARASARRRGRPAPAASPRTGGGCAPRRAHRPARRGAARPGGVSRSSRSIS